MIDCFVGNNAATWRGGALYCYAQSWPALTNCTIVGNYGAWYGGAIDCEYSSSNVILSNCILWNDMPAEVFTGGSSVTLSYCDVRGGWPGDGNIDADPLLTRDGHQIGQSPCRNAGDPAYEYSGQHDIDEEPRLVQERIDIGCDEWLDNDDDGLPDWWELRYFSDPTAAPPGDSDGDGSDNLEEYAQGTHPLFPPRPHYVNPAGNDAWDGLAPAWDGAQGPKATIQAALDDAYPGDEVILADGTYSGLGNRDLDFHGKTLNLHSAGGDPAVCVLDCQFAGRGFYFHSQETAQATVRGLTVTHGMAFSLYHSQDASGAGVACNSGSCPTFLNCRITENFTDYQWSEGTGVFCAGNATFVNCDITGNTSQALYNCGVGMACTGDPVLINCRLTRNTAAGYHAAGVGLYCAGHPTLVNCTIAGNAMSVTWGYGVGLAVESSAPVLQNCIIWGNGSDDIYAEGSPDITYCDIGGGWPGEGNLNTDPRFVDAASGNYHLRGDSPCIDAGAPDFAPEAGASDPDGHRRIWDGDADGTPRVDMGAFEFGSFAYGDLNCDGAVNAFDIEPFVLALTDPAGYAAAFPGCDSSLADANADGLVNAFDIDAFVRLLTGG